MSVNVTEVVQSVTVTEETNTITIALAGTQGAGVPDGGTAGQLLSKIDGTDYNTEWTNPPTSATWGSITGTLSSQTDLQSSLNLKAPLDSPALTGTPTAPTASGGTNTTQVATTAFVTSAVASGATPDATTVIKGKVQLAGDLAGTAALPTVPRLPLPYYTEGEILPTGNSFGTAFDMDANASWSSNAKVLLSAAATSGQGILLGNPTDNFRLEIINLGAQTLNIYPQSGHTIFRFGTEVTDEAAYIRGDETIVITGINSTTWVIENAGVNLEANHIYGVLGISRGGTGSVSGAGLPYMSQNGDNGFGTYQFDTLAFGQFIIFDSSNSYFSGFSFLTSTGNGDFFEMVALPGGGRVVGTDANNVLTYFGGTPGASDGLAWDAGTNRLQTYSTFLVGNWEFDGVDTLQNSDGVLTAAQLKYWDSSVFDISATGINFMNSNVNISSIANGGNLGVGASASATRKIWSQSTANPQLTLAYNNSTAFVDMTTASTSGLTFRPASNTASGFRWQNSAGTTDILNINTTNTEISMGIGANTVGFFRGGSNITPQFVLGASGGKAVSLLAGSSGTAFSYDSTGTFSISTELRATMVAGTSSGGTQRVFLNSSGNMAVLGSSGATNATPVDYLQIGDPAGVNQSLGASEFRLRFGTSNRSTITQNLTANGNGSGGLSCGDGTTYAYYGARSGRAVINAGQTLGFSIGGQNATNWGAITPVQYSTGTASQSGTTVTGVGTTFTTAMVGSEMTYADGTSSGVITAFGSTTSLTVTTSQTIGSQNYRILYPAIEITSAGLVGINTATSLTSSLTIRGQTEFRETSSGSNLLNFKNLAGTSLWNVYMVSGDLRFYDTVAALDRFVIQDSNGFIGIGTSAPQSLLSIKTNASTSCQFSGTDVAIQFTGTDEVKNDMALYWDGSIFHIRDTGSSANRFSCTQAGIVSIGTSGATQRLNIGAGSVLVDNTYGYRGKSAGGTEFNFLSVSAADNVSIAAPSGGDININGSSTFILKSTGTVGLGVASPSAKFHTIHTTEQQRIGYDTSNYYSTTVSSAGAVTFDAVGASAGFTFSDNIKLTQTVTTEVVISDTTVTIVINGTTYKLLAKA